MSVPIPDGAARRRTTLIVAGSATVLVLLAVGAWALLRPEATVVPPRVFTPAQETTASAPATSSAVASALAGVEASSPAPGVVASEPVAAAVTPKIAFHLGSSLYVANEDGTGAVALKVTESEYALSPDGVSLAVVRGGKLGILAVASGSEIIAGAAEAVPPVWTSDSSTLLFVRSDANGNPSIWRVARNGSGAKRVCSGLGVAVSPDGKVMAVLPAETDDGARDVTIVAAGKPTKKVALSGGDPIAVAVSDARVFVSTLSTAGAAAIWSSSLSGTDKREVVGAGATGVTEATYGRLMLSPDGRSLAYTADGDDGYSRIWVVPVGGGAPRQVTGRRDGYLLGWSADSKAILFFEGNSFQGETSALWRADPNGGTRRMIVSGAVR